MGGANHKTLARWKLTSTSLGQSVSSCSYYDLHRTLAVNKLRWHVRLAASSDHRPGMLTCLLVGANVWRMRDQFTDEERTESINDGMHWAGGTSCCAGRLRNLNVMH